MSLQDIERAIAQLPPDQRAELIARLNEPAGDGAPSDPPDEVLPDGLTVLDLIRPLMSSGTGPPAPDLSTNRKYLDGLGESSLS